MLEKKILVLTVTLLLLLVSLGPPSGLAQEVVEKSQADTSQTEPESEKVIASPQSIKEETGIFVFIAWMWLSIFVLLFFLRLKIKEADRLYRIEFFSREKE